MTHAKRWMMACLLAMVLLGGVVSAQDTAESTAEAPTASETTSAPAPLGGVTLGLFLLGLGGIAAAGFAMAARGNTPAAK
jgi:hypothetical protein